MKKNIFNIKLGWLYPDLMSTYGDRGNILVFKRRCENRGIKVEIVKINLLTSSSDIKSCDIIFGGGSQDRQQDIVISDLKKKYKKILKKMFTEGVPGLFVCGSPQLLGHYYITGDGKKLEGLGIFDMVTKHYGSNIKRCIGNTVGLINPEIFIDLKIKTIVGFENHGGRTFLGREVKPFASVIKGYGNNGQDKTEGAVYRNVIACYYHGPFLPRNPHIADWLIRKTIHKKYNKKIILLDLDDIEEWQAHNFLLKYLKINKKI